ncbi:VOC family protein [Citricoccus parietis]|uniref:VOC family protein n=2 Tax=Citricoccus parietis TaxID=592307 RepID=A0ABV6F2A1_9MICC
MSPSEKLPHRPRPVIAPRLHHATFLTMKLDEMVSWYEKVCGLTPTFYSEVGAWLSNDEANHRLALVAHPAIRRAVDKPTSHGHHHTAFEYEQFQSWLDNYVRLRDEGIVPFMSIDHGLTMSLYYADPEGNGVEIQVDNFGDWARSTQWQWGSREFAENPIGNFFDPDKIVAAAESGLTFAEIHEKAYAGEYLPENPPADILLPEAY